MQISTEENLSEQTVTVRDDAGGATGGTLMVNIYTCGRLYPFTFTLTLISTHRNWNATTSLPV